MGLLDALQGFGVAGQFITGMWDSARAQKQARYLNELAEEGRGQLQNLRGEIRPQMEGEARGFYDRRNAQNRDAFETQRRTQNAALLSQFRGPGGADPTSSLERPTEDILAGMDPSMGNGPMSRAVLDQTEEFRGRIGEIGQQTFGAARTSIDDTRRKVDSNFEAMKQTLDANLQTVLTTADNDLNASIAGIDSTRKDLFVKFDEVMSGFAEEASYSIATAVSSGIQALTSISGAFSARMTGDPEKDAAVVRQMNAAKAGYTEKAREATNAVSATMRNFIATQKQEAFGTLEEGITKLEDTRSGAYQYHTGATRAAVDDYNRERNAAIRDHNSGNISLDELNTKLADAEAAFYGNAELNVFSTKTQADQYDINLYNKAVDDASNLSRWHDASQQQTELAFTEFMNNAILNDAALATTAAMSYINAEAAFVGFAQNFGTLNQNLSAMQAQQLQQEQLDLANRQADWQAVGTIMSPFRLGVGVTHEV